MANSGTNTNGSQFFILFSPCPELDGKHTVFGRVISGLATLKQIESISTTKDAPDAPVTIADCGILEIKLTKSEVQY